MRNYKTEFLIKTILGQKTDLNDPKDVIERCLSCAYDDMNTAGRFYSEGRNKNLFLRSYSDLLQRTGFVFSRELIEDVLELFGSCDTIEGKRNTATRFGLSQKLVNMTFKYLYVFDEYTGLKIDFSNCDCPLDSIVLDAIGRKDVVWSKMTKDKYQECQNTIHDLLEKESKYSEKDPNIGRMAFDFFCW